MSGKFALIIGNSRYDDASLGRLKAPDIDVYELESVLKSPEVGRFDEVTTLLNQDCASVRKAIARFYDQRQRDDLLLLYFSGHGVKDEQGHLYLALRDTESGLLAGSAIETAFISGRMDRSFSKRQVLVLDCCHSGAFAHGAKAAQGASVGTAEAFEGTGQGRVVLTATDSTQYAWEGDQIIGDAPNSLFTHFLIEGLKTGAADKDADGVVTVDELYDYVREQVVTTTPKQTPHKWSYLQRGDIVIAQNPFAARSALPTEIEEAINSKLSGLRLEAVSHLDALLRGHDAGRARAAWEALKALSLDDSRKVANAAAQVISARDQEAGRSADPAARVDGAAAQGLDPARPSDIFISYAHEDQARARALAGVLAARGWKVWWDRKIAPGEAYDVIIERELGTCKCAIVLWSATSVHATWVRNEARRAARRKVLLPILIDAVEMPLEFENLQAADLTSWKDTGEDPELEAVVDRILALSPIPNEARAREAVEQARQEVAAGRRGAARSRLEQFRPAHPLVSRMLTELREDERLERDRTEAARREAEAARSAQQRAEAARREVEAARVEQERVETAKREAEAARIERERAEAQQRAADAARIEQERAETARREAETARVEREHVETARRMAEAARVERERVEAARRAEDAARAEHQRMDAARQREAAARVQRERDTAERLAAETRIKREHARPADDPSLERATGADAPTPSSISTGRVLIAAAALVAVIAASWFAGLIPHRSSDDIAVTSPRRPGPTVATTSPAPSSSERPRPMIPAVEQTGASTTGAGAAPTPVPNEAPPAARPEAETVAKNPIETLPVKKGGAKRLDDLRTLALSRMQSGAPREALNAAVEGLRIDVGDPALKNLVGTLLRDAQASARRAREDAVEADAERNDPDQFQQGVNREREALRLQRAGKLDAATRGFWGAADQFIAAASESRETAKEEKAAAERELRRRKTAEAAPAPPTPSRPKPDERAVAERPLVDQALRRYEAAFASLSTDNVRGVYPSAPLDQLAKDFANSRSYTLTIQPDSYQFVFTDTLTAATVAARIGHETTPKSGGRGTKVERTQTIQLEKQGANWIIKQIR
jgi:Caspase domain/TIR domain